MNTQNLIKYSERTRQSAQEMLADTGIIPAWESIGATVHIVGSLKSGLMMKNRDIDLHIYTGRLSIAESFSVVRQLAEKLPLTEIQYRNLIGTEEKCIEWHALYEDKNKQTWKLDMIHIRKGSKYDGVVEKVTDAIICRSTPELREDILRIKYDIPDGVAIPGIEIYHAVFEGNVKSYEALQQWRKTNPLTDSLDWLP